jgi:hypothetical protein
MTVRQVFYQLVARGVIEKTEEQYQGTVIRLMTEMRLDGSLPYSLVVDESRRVASQRHTTASPTPSSKPRTSIVAARSRKLRTTSKSGARRTHSQEPSGT